VHHTWGIADLNNQGGRIPAFHMGKGQLPLALEGSTTDVPSLNIAFKAISPKET
jgi:hypothetical protein